MPKGVQQKLRHCLTCGDEFVSFHWMQKFCSDLCRFTPKIEYGECWIWKGARRNVYGCFHNPIDDRSNLAHRESYELFCGPIPEGFDVLHHCDTPLCVRPSHLWLGTDRENKDDEMYKLRHCFGVRNGRAKLSEKDVTYIRQRLETNKQAAEKFGVSASAISWIRTGKHWTHI